MPKRDMRLLLADTLDAIAKVERYAAGLSYETFEQNDLVVGGMVRNLEIIGEAARQLPPELRQRYPVVDWTRVVGFRNIVVHAYFDVDVEIVWTIATQRLPELKAVLQADAKGSIAKTMETQFERAKDYPGHLAYEVAQEGTLVLSKRHPQFGSAKGLVVMAEDFDAPLEDFSAYMP